MNRFDDSLPPMSEAQQAETLRLAARLQAEHEARTSSDALFLAAAEAGIDPRFVQEASRRIVRQSLEPARSSMSRPFVAILVLMAMNGLALAQQSAESAAILLEPWQIVALVVAAFAASVWVGRERRVRWAMPLAIVAVWLALGLPDAAYHLAVEGRSLRWLIALIVIVGGMQFAAALAGSFVGGYRTIRARANQAQFR